MRFPRRWLAVCQILLHLLRGGLIVLVRFPSLNALQREELVRWWSMLILRYVGITVKIKGNCALRDTGHMLVLNHISWIDIYVVNVYRATSFVAKSEIRGWPLIGWLCENTETIFLERGRARALHRVIDDMQSALARGAVVGVFAEGTTTDGSELLPFHSNLLQAARASECAIVPVAIRYLNRVGKMATEVGYVGDMSLWASLMMTLKAAPITAELEFLIPIESSLGRREIAASAQRQIALSLGFSEGASGRRAIPPNSGEITQVSLTSR